MNKLSNFLTGIRILEETESSFSGKITVISGVAFGKYIQVGGLTQSGGIIKSIWNKSLKEVKNKKNDVKTCLVLGLGGGSVVDVIHKYWPDVKITAVDIDPVMVELGEKYLGLNRNDIKVEIGDAYEKSKSIFKSKISFDLISIDLYNGDVFPPKFEKLEFLKLILKLLTENGIAVFNRLYYGEKRSQSVKFGNLLSKVFSKVEVVYPEANIMFVCDR